MTDPLDLRSADLGMPASSWWTLSLTRAEFERLAEREALRMRLSKVGKHVPSMIVGYVAPQGRTR